jgi:hypothetical protein
MSATAPGDDCTATEEGAPLAEHNRVAPRKRKSRQKKAPVHNGRHTAAVFARVRPLLEHLGEGGEAKLPGLCTHAAGRGVDGAEEQDIAALDGRSRVGGYTGVLGPEEDNSTVFARAFRPCL